MKKTKSKKKAKVIGKPKPPKSVRIEQPTEPDFEVQIIEASHEQNGKCGICGEIMTGREAFYPVNGQQSGIIKGLLCGYCKHHLVNSWESPMLLVKAALFAQRMRCS